MADVFSRLRGLFFGSISGKKRSKIGFFFALFGTDFVLLCGLLCSILSEILRAPRLQIALVSLWKFQNFCRILALTDAIVRSLFALCSPFVYPSFVLRFALCLLSVCSPICPKFTRGLSRFSRHIACRFIRFLLPVWALFRCKNSLTSPNVKKTLRRWKIRLWLLVYK